MTATIPPTHDQPAARSERPELPALLAELLPLLAEGLTYQHMARRLNRSVDGVRSRVKRLLKLFGARNAAHAVAIAYQRGLLHRDTQHAIRVRRELAARHHSTCALLNPRVCNCGADPTRPRENGAHPRP